MAKVIVQREAKPTIIVLIVNPAAAAEIIEAKPIIVQIVDQAAAAETIVQREAKPIVVQIVNPAVKAFIQDTGKLHLLLLKLFVL